jgi:autotransporter-associated beta strand protein
MPSSMRRNRYLWQAIVVFALSLVLTSPVLAAVYSWDAGGGDNNWDTVANWDPDSPAGGPGVGDDLGFGFGATVNLVVGRTVDSVTINADVIFPDPLRLETGDLSVINPHSITLGNAGTRLLVTNQFAKGTNAVTLNGPGIFDIQGTYSLNGNGPLTLAAGARLLFNGNQTLHLPNAGTGGGSTISLSNNAVLDIYHTGAGLNFQGTITGTGSISKSGGGTVGLSGINTYTGSTTVNAGTLTVANPGSVLPNTTDVTIAGGATLYSDTQDINNLSGSGTLSLTAGSTFGIYQTGNTTYSGNVLAGVGATLNLPIGGSLTMTGAVAPAIAFGIGTLVFNGTSADNISQSDGTLMGTGTCNGTLQIAGGNFAPGNSIGTFNSAGNFIMQAGSNLNIEVSGATADQVAANGTVNLASNLIVTGGPTKGAVSTIINKTSVGAVAGTFAGLNEGDVFTSGGYQYQISYVGGDGNDVTLTALTGVTPGEPAPEPEPAPTGPDAPSVTSGSGPSPIGSLEGTPLTWPSVKGADHYRIYRADCPNCKRTAIGWVADTSFVDATAVAGKPYYYWIRSENNDGMGPYSNWMVAWRYEQNPGRVGDFNGDGIMDLLWWNPDNNQLSIWFMNNGAVQSVSASGEALNIAEWLLVATADFNGDGACDLLWWKPETGETKVWYLDKNKAMAGGDGEWLIKNSVTLDTVEGHAAMAYPGDLNGDGKSDILWRDYTNGQVTLWIMGDDGKPHLNGPPTPADDNITRGECPGVSGTLNWQVANLSDADGNGKSDVIWKDARNNRLTYWTMNGAAISAAIQENKSLDVVWRLVGVGDLNGDKQTDVVWRHEASGAVQAWLMQNKAFSEERTIVEGSQEATQWQVKAVGDFCQAGTDDIYCKHSESSVARIYTLGGGEHNPTAD